MKKSLRKLSLSRETLRALDGPALADIAGGIIQPTELQTCQTGPNSCECTFALNCTTRTTKTTA